MKLRKFILTTLLLSGITRAIASDGVPNLTLAAVTPQPLQAAPQPLLIAPQPSPLDSRVQRIEDQLSEVRRDQLNYRVEKDLLEKAYSINYQIINGALTLFLAVVSIIGFFGIRDINTLKDKFSKELAVLSNSRTSFETQVATAKATLDAALAEVRETKASIEAELKRQVAVNDTQNNRIKVLEIQEKVADLIRNGANQRAFEYVTVGLALDPKNAILLRFRGTVFWRMGDLTEAMATFKHLLELDPADVNTALNAMELSLITPDFTTYADLIKKYGAHVISRDDSALGSYFEILELYQRGDTAKAITAIKDWLNKNPLMKKHCGDWHFSEAIQFLEKRPASKERDAMRLFIASLNNAIDPKVALAQVNALFP